MQALKALIAVSPATALAVGGAIIGLLFGAIVSRTNYCTMGAITDWRLTGDKGRLGAVALAAATAMTGAQCLDAYGVVELSKSMYLAPRINWAGALGGGLLFGYGMVYAGGCPSRTLIRAGGGDVRGLVSLVVMAIAAYATISGVLAGARVALENATAIDVKAFGAPTQHLGELLYRAHVTASPASLIALLAVLIPLLAFAAGPARVFSRGINIAGGLAVGGLAIAGWALTGLASDEFAASPLQPVSLSFVRPVADTIDWIERSTALGMPGFGVTSVLGVLAGASLAAWLSGSFRLIGYSDRRDAIRHVAGAAAMGIGGVMALGCTIGQGVSGLSTLSVQSLIACAAIVAGAVIGLQRLEKSL
ncbi:MAG: YeeE/YedE family protein [Hyphomicrobium sp.]|nr:YeeE/YedE family protein [Hyphomicrobium sp.]